MEWSVEVFLEWSVVTHRRVSVLPNPTNVATASTRKAWWKDTFRATLSINAVVGNPSNSAPNNHCFRG